MGPAAVGRNPAKTRVFTNSCSEPVFSTSGFHRFMRLTLTETPTMKKTVRSKIMGEPTLLIFVLLLLAIGLHFRVH